MRTLACLLIVGTAFASSRPQDSTADAETLVSRLGNYLAEYEAAISTLIAHERYRQSETSFRGQTQSPTANDVVFRTRTLESEVAFLRLPGDREWFGVRNVRQVDRREVKAARNLTDALKASGSNLEESIRAIVKASSEHNIGAARTINMPTVPLELLHPRNRNRFAFSLGRSESIAGVATREIRYREQRDRGLIRDQEARQLLASGSAWVEPTGRLRRVTLRLEHAHQAVVNGRTGANELRVDFAFDANLTLMLPREMWEEFEVRGGGQFKGRATYSNFRRFTTSARIVPQP